MLLADPDVEHEGLAACESLLNRQAFDCIRYFKSVHSTNTAAMEELQQFGPSEYPRLYLADEQTAGRGRLGRSWHADRGTLTFTLVTQHLASDTPEQLAPSIAVGVAIARTLEHLAAPLVARLKWPNDVYLSGGKVAGILVEASAAHRDTLVIGVGLNVATHWCKDTMPADVPVTSVKQFCQRHPNRYAWLEESVSQILAAMQTRQSDADELVQEHHRRCLLKDQPVRYLLQDQWRTGHCQGIDQQGRLQIWTDQQSIWLNSGDVQRCRLDRA